MISIAFMIYDLYSTSLPLQYNYQWKLVLSLSLNEYAETILFFNRNFIRCTLEKLSKILFSKSNLKLSYWLPTSYLRARFSHVFHHYHNPKTISALNTAGLISIMGLESWKWCHLAPSESEAITQSTIKYFILKSVLVLLDPGSPEANEKWE